jgi:hypothetical protein
MRARIAVGIACLPLLVPACFSSSSTDDTATMPLDSGGEGVDATEPQMDATMPPPPMEAGALEASPLDVVEPTPDVTVAPTTVTVVVVNDLGPEPGVPVVFQDANGAVVESAVTDASGKATATAVAGSQVTGAFGSGVNLQLVTIEDVAPGDVLTMYDASRTTNTLVDLDSLPDAAPPSGTDSYILNIGPCNANFPAALLPVELNLSPDCMHRGTFPVLVQAMDSTTSTEVGYAFQTGNVLATDGGGTHFSLSGAWSPPGPTQTINVSNASAALSGTAAFSEIADGVPVGKPVFFTPDADGGATLTFQTHPGYPTAVQSEANQGTSRAGGGVLSAIATRGAPTSDGGVTSFDLSSLLPLIDAATLDTSQPAQPVVSWTTEAGSLASANGTIVNFTWYQPDDAGNSVQAGWTILAPPSATNVKAPALPPLLSSWVPLAGASFSTPPVVIVVQGSGSLVPDYAHLRAQFSALPTQSSVLYNDLSMDPVIPPLPVDGTAKLTAFTTPGG